MVIVPNELRDEIYRRVDRVLADAPEEAQAGREDFYQELLNHFDEHGYIPEFVITKRIDGGTDGA